SSIILNTLRAGGPCSAEQHFLSVEGIDVLPDRLNLAVLHLEHQVIIVLVGLAFGALAAGHPLYCHAVSLGDGVAHLDGDTIRLKQGLCLAEEIFKDGLLAAVGAGDGQRARNPPGGIVGECGFGRLDVAAGKGFDEAQDDLFVFRDSHGTPPFLVVAVRREDYLFLSTPPTLALTRYAGFSVVSDFPGRGEAPIKSHLVPSSRSTLPRRVPAVFRRLIRCVVPVYGSGHPPWAVRRSAAPDNLSSSRSR